MAIHPPELLGGPVRFHRLLQQASEGHPRPRPLHLHERVREGGAFLCTFPGRGAGAQARFPQRDRHPHALSRRRDPQGRLGHFFVVSKIAFHRHQPQKAENERDDNKQGQYRAPDAFRQIFEHICAHPSLL